MSSDTNTWTFGIDTNDDIVNLTGKIDNQAEKDKITSIIHSTKDVVGINDDVTITS